MTSLTRVRFFLSLLLLSLTYEWNQILKSDSALLYTKHNTKIWNSTSQEKNTPRKVKFLVSYEWQHRVSFDFSRQNSKVNISLLHILENNWILVTSLIHLEGIPQLRREIHINPNQPKNIWHSIDNVKLWALSDNVWLQRKIRYVFKLPFPIDLLAKYQIVSISVYLFMNSNIRPKLSTLVIFSYTSGILPTWTRWKKKTSFKVERS